MQNETDEVPLIFVDSNVIFLSVYLNNILRKHFAHRIKTDLERYSC